MFHKSMNERDHGLN